MTEDRLIWCDIETTGLDPRKELLLEVGFKITDLDLNVIDDRQVTIWTTPDYDEHCKEDKVDPFVWEMHKKSGLWDVVQSEGSKPGEARTWIYEWINGHGVSKDEPLCGSSVQFDRLWLDMWMPEVINRFSYRNIDISTLKELCRRYNPELYTKLEDDVPNHKLHRVLPDLDDTIAEFKFYRDNFLFWKD